MVTDVWYECFGQKPVSVLQAPWSPWSSVIGVSIWDSSPGFFFRVLAASELSLFHNAQNKQFNR